MDEIRRPVLILVATLLIWVEYSVTLIRQFRMECWTITLKKKNGSEQSFSL